MMTLKIALRNIFRHKVRSLVTLSTMVFGCVALIFVGGFFEDVFIKIREGFIGSQVGHIQIYKRGFIENGRVDPFKYLIEKPDEIKELLKRIQDIEFTTSRLEFEGLISTGSNTFSFAAQGIEPDKELSVPLKDISERKQQIDNKYNGLPVMEVGKALEKDDFYTVVLGKGLAETMDAKLGDSIVLLTSTVAGSTNALDVTVKGTFVTSTKEFDDIFIRVPLTLAQNLLDTQSVQSIVVKLHKTEDTSKVYNILKKMIIARNMDLEIQRWEDVADNYKKTVELFDMFYFILQIVIGIVVILGIFNTMNMSVMERLSEIGTIMALGTRRSTVLKQFLFEGAVLGFVGGSLGIATGSIILGIIFNIGIEMPPPPGGNFTWLSTPILVPSKLLFTFVMCIVIGGISSLYPAYKASRLQIVEALRYR